MKLLFKSKEEKEQILNNLSNSRLCPDDFYKAFLNKPIDNKPIDIDDKDCKNKCKECWEKHIEKYIIV